MTQNTIFPEIHGNFGFGFMRIPRLEDGSVNQPLVNELVDSFMTNGFNYFDTAYKYCGGLSEPALRKALVDRYPRDSYVLTTKLSNEFMKSKDEQERVFEDQLRILGVDYFDFYLLHNQGKVNYAVTEELESLEFMLRKKEEGKIRHIGMSFHDSAELLDEILTVHPEIEVVQLQINYLDWDNASIQSRKCLEVANRHEKPVIVMEPNKGGNLIRLPEEVEKLFRAYAPERSNASWALRFAASQPGVIMVLSGMNTMEQLADNMQTMGDFQPLNTEELALTTRAAEIINRRLLIPCTGCGYCTVQCPKHIPIPDYFALFQEGYMSTQIVYYFNMTQTHPKAGECIHCHLCEKHCPQHIEITKHLETIAQKFDGFKGWR